MRDSRWKILIWPLGIALAIGLYFSENIRGHYRFKQMCAKDGGVRIITPIEIGSIHEAENLGRAEAIAAIRGVLAARTVDDKSGALVDVRLASGVGGTPSAVFETLPADKSRPARYKWIWINQKMERQQRSSRSGWEVYDIVTNELVLSDYLYGYATFDPKTVLGGGPGGAACPSREFGEAFKEIQNSFVKK